MLVTIGSGPKFFSIGFDLPYWIEDARNARASLERFQELMARLMTLRIPSMAVLNGTAIAGGYWLGLSHDFRIMNANVGTICLSELKLGLFAPFPYTRVLSAKLKEAVVAKLLYTLSM